MTPKEKADELVYKMHNVDFHDLPDELAMQFTHAKLCALIAADEILTALEVNHWQNRMIMDYYLEIKQEIEKL